MRHTSMLLTFEQVSSVGNSDNCFIVVVAEERMNYALRCLVGRVRAVDQRSSLRRARKHVAEVYVRSFSVGNLNGKKARTKPLQLLSR